MYTFTFKIILLFSILASTATTSAGWEYPLVESNTTIEGGQLMPEVNLSTITPVVQSDHFSEVEKEGITCTQLGLVKNDINAGHSNMALLLQAVQGGKKVLVDGVYYLKHAEVLVPLSDTFLSLTGSTWDAELKLDGNSNAFFNIADNVDVHISNLKVTQVGTSERYFMVFKSDCLSNKVVIEGNTFTGKIKFMYFPGETAIDPLANPFGIKEFYFTKNKVNDAATSFMELVDMPSDKMVIEDNVINNFDYVFLSNGITNDITYADEMFAAKKLMIVRNNRVTCDDDWWGDSSNLSYYCFVLFEGTDVVYAGNHIEGLKFSSASGSGAAVYDAYLSCKNLQYTNNVWKNNLNFNPAKQNNILLKSKGGPKDVTRYYENNTYLIEESYIRMCSAQLARLYAEDPTTRLAADFSASWIEFISLTTNCSTYKILNNTFDVYDLRLPSSCIPVEQMHMEGNTFRCKKIGGSLLYYHLVDAVDYSDKIHIVRNNTIYSEGLRSSESLYIVSAADHGAYGNNEYGTILVENNTIAAPCSYLLSETRASQAVVTGNTVELIAPGTLVYPRGISPGSYIDDLVFRDNTFINNIRPR